MFFGLLKCFKAGKSNVVQNKKIVQAIYIIKFKKTDLQILS